MSSKADRYEARVPETGIGEAQKQERMERLDFREESRSLRRTGRNRGVVIPDCAYTRALERGERP